MTIAAAFQAFMSSDFEPACDSATKASWGGSGYSVELFDDGTYRVLWDDQIGNCYDSPGLILGIPTLNDEEWDDDPTHRFYDNAREEMLEFFKQHERANQEVQAAIANS